MCLLEQYVAPWCCYHKILQSLWSHMRTYIAKGDPYTHPYHFQFWFYGWQTPKTGLSQLACSSVTIDHPDVSAGKTFFFPLEVPWWGCRFLVYSWGHASPLSIDFWLESCFVSICETLVHKPSRVVVEAASSLWNRNPDKDVKTTEITLATQPADSWGTQLQ